MDSRARRVQTQLRRQCQPCQLFALGLRPRRRALSGPGVARPVQPIAQLLSQQRHRQTPQAHVHRVAGNRDETGGCL